MSITALPHVASFDVDAQKGFTELCPNELPVKGGQDIAGALNAMAQHARLRIGSKDAHCANPLWAVDSAADMGPLAPPLPDADRSWLRHCVAGTQGFELLDGLPHPRDYDFFVWKGVEPDMHPYGACFHDLALKRSTGVIEYLSSHNITTVLVGGLAFDYCVKDTALQLKKAGFEVIIIKEATRALAEESRQAAEETLLKAGIIVCNNTTQLNLTALPI